MRNPNHHVPRGSTTPHFTLLIVGVIMVVVVLDVFHRRFGFGLSFRTSLLVLGGLVGLAAVMFLVYRLLFARRNRKLAREYGIRYEEEAPAHLKERLDNFDGLPDYGFSYQYSFYLKDEGKLRAAVFQHGWETGFGDLRRSHTAPAFAVDLAAVPELSATEVLALFEPQADLQSAEQDGLFVVFTEKPSHPALLPEHILPAVGRLYTMKTAANHSAGDGDGAA